MSAYPIGECLGYCGDTGVALFDDMKSPPMDTEPCLCRVCAEAHAEEAIEEHESEIGIIRDFIGDLP